jgi:hypothetical protein
MKLTKATTLCVLALLLLTSRSWGQSGDTTRTLILNGLWQDFTTKYSLEKVKAEKWATDLGLATLRVFENGKIMQILHFSNNRPLFMETDNYNSALTVSTNRVWPGGSAGSNLDGAGINIGQWDGGAVLDTHQELVGRVTRKDYTSAQPLSLHATHVAGTLIAAGIDPDAKGMAFAANLLSYDWNNDAAEMAGQAALNLMLSNNSYGHVLGWHYNYFGDNLWTWLGDPSVSATEDYFFGLYSNYARDWDRIAYNAPYFLIVKSAGNDRDDAGPVDGQAYWIYESGVWKKSTVSRQADGDYDCLGDYSVAKNILTVGGIADITDGNFASANITAKMTPFSAWGPTDDGRIKPDLVASASTVYSTVSSSATAYGELTGTSVSAPNVTGSLALLQQHYHNMHNNEFMRAATAKALVVHTAREAGPADGPDYQFGWGLLNTEAAVQVIDQNVMTPIRVQELSVTYGDNDVEQLTVTAYGTEPLKVTICWTDPAGTPVYGLDPATPMLVNDLDLRVKRLADNTVYYPWRLDRDHPSAPAEKGDNTVDNVEQIVIPNPLAGDYFITVDHKGMISSGMQYFSMIITGAGAVGATQTLTMAVDPVGGGIVVPASGTHSYGRGATIPLSATPASGYVFSHWTGPVAQSAEPSTSVVLNSNVTVTAHFNALSNPAISTWLRLVSNLQDTPMAGQGVLTLQVMARAIDGQLHDINDFNGAFYLDAVMRQQTTAVVFAAGFFPTATYGSQVQSYDNNQASPYFGRVLYQYHHSSSAFKQIGPDSVAIVTVQIGYQMTTQRGAISWNNGSSEYTVHDQEGRPIAGEELLPLPQNLFDIALPVELTLFEAAWQTEGALLRWITGSETENLGFYVDRRRQGEETWTRITNAMIDGAGNSQAKHSYDFMDQTADRSDSWEYRLTDVNYQGQMYAHEIITLEKNMPTRFALEQNYPNPFNPATLIRYSLHQAGAVQLLIYNVNGQLVRKLVDGQQSAGMQEVRWDGNDEFGRPAASGLYFYTLLFGQQRLTRKMQLVK